MTTSPRKDPWATNASPNQTHTHAALPPQRPTSPALPAVMVWIGSGGSVVALLFLIMALWPKPTPPRPCTHAATWLTTIAQQEQNGQYSLAAANTQTALTSPHLCPADQSVLEQKVVDDSLSALFNLPYDPHDAAAQVQALDQYRAIRTSANRFRASIPTNRQLATWAYRVGQYLVTKAALEQAVTSGQATTRDRDMLQLYASATYNAGVILSRWGRARLKSEGLGLLALSNQVDTCYRVDDESAIVALQQFVGRNQAAWPRLVPSPLLASCQATGRPGHHGTQVRKDTSRE